MNWTPDASTALDTFCRENKINTVEFWTLRECIEELAKKTGAHQVNVNHVNARCGATCGK